VPTSTNTLPPFLCRSSNSMILVAFPHPKGFATCRPHRSATGDGFHRPPASKA
jgi:hypothetical protein